MSNRTQNQPGVKSDGTLFSIIGYLRDNGSAGVTEIASELDLAKSTVHDHLSSLREHGFVTKRNGKYCPGLEFFSVGQEVRMQFDIYEAAKPVVDSLIEETDEMVWLFTHEDGRAMCLYGHSGGTNVDDNLLIGSWAYMHCNSAGKSMLANLPDAEIEAIIDQYGLPARTSNTITDRDELHTELEEIREQGYALNMGEDLQGIHAIGVPLVFEDEVKGALSIAGPAHDVDQDRCEKDLAETLFAAQNDIELNMAYT